MSEPEDCSSDDSKKPRYDDVTMEILQGWFHDHEQVRFT